MHRIFSIILFICLLSPGQLLAQSCLPEGIEITTQGQIDSFAINYPGCTEIEGDVHIEGEDISNLNGLITINAIYGDFFIGGFNGGNPSLETLSGLDNLINIGGDFWIEDNDVLINLIGLSNLTTIGGDFSVERNDSMVRFIGLENIELISGTFRIISNDGLINLNGINNLSSVGKSLDVFNNNKLEEIDALQSIDTIGVDLRI
ncbi:MAG: hypothetical protein DRJ15_03630, partial [Bacteroidetes bacterium]